MLRRLLAIFSNWTCANCGKENPDTVTDKCMECLTKKNPK